MSNVIEFTRKGCDKQYLVGQQSLDELAAISRYLTTAKMEPAPTGDALDGIEHLGDILDEIERHPVEGRPHIDVQGQVLMIGIFSDLCGYRNSEVEQGRARELDAIVKRLGKLIERYEPQGPA